jgi:hypothetical protein
LRKLVALDIKFMVGCDCKWILMKTTAAVLGLLLLLALQVEVLCYHTQQQETMTLPPVLLRPAPRSTRMTSLSGT